MLAHCELPLIYHKMCYKEIRIPPKLRVLPCGTLLQTLDLENFVTASRWCDRQNSSTVAPVDYTYDGRARHGWMHNAWLHIGWLSSSNSISSTYCVFVVQFVPLFLHCCAAVGKILTDTSRRVVRLRQIFLLPLSCFFCQLNSSTVKIQVSVVPDGPAWRAASFASRCTQRWTLSAIN